MGVRNCYLMRKENNFCNKRKILRSDFQVNCPIDMEKQVNVEEVCL
jgi:hypothetical protein